MSMKEIINQLFEIEKKVSDHNLDMLERNLTRIFHQLEEMGYQVVNPIGKRYDERDASVEANILNPNAETITRVLKPVIYTTENGNYTLLQKGVVIVE
jgi:hypothetical protein